MTQYRPDPHASDRPQVSPEPPVNGARDEAPGGPVPPRTEGAAGPGDAPPGWEDYQQGADARRAPRPEAPDIASILALLDSLRDVVPRELGEQWGALVREVLLTLRALIDWYLERLDAPPREAKVEDIPID